MPAVSFAVSCGDAPAVVDWLDAESWQLLVPFGVPIPRPTGLEPPSAVRVTFTVPAWATVNVKMLAPPTASVPVKLWGELVDEGLPGAEEKRFLMSLHPVDRTTRAATATP